MKIILIDWGFIMHQSIFSYNSAMKRKQKNPDMFVPPSTYTAMSSLIGCLKKIGYSEEENDKIILCCDGRHSWRKDIEKEYKSNRPKEKAKAEFINWEKEYEQHNELIDKINNSLFFYIIKIETLEADDIISEAVRYFVNNQCIIVSPDEDMLQLLIYDNVRIFSPHPKVKLHPYKILSLNRDKEKELAYKSLMKKVEKEKTDNLLNEVLTEEDYDKRLKCVSLLNLPKEISDKIIPYLEYINNTEKEMFEIEVFSPGITQRLPTIFDNKNIISYEVCLKYFERKLNRIKNKKEVKK
jgi:hypothetical protein